MTFNGTSRPETAAGRALIALSVWGAIRSTLTLEQLVANAYDTTVLGDFLAEVMHLLALHRVDLDEWIDTGRLHFDAETTSTPPPDDTAATGVALAAQRIIIDIEAATPTQPLPQH
ncbi:hypothetical protein [Nocardia carnea]|uniref:hypothetical protein n=1 Tax=Nocardia carnea TaxID=37328 RepID=UPI002458C36D|nr:hypothetical protein [Nocardia carnea]